MRDRAHTQCVLLSFLFLLAAGRSAAGGVCGRAAAAAARPLPRRAAHLAQSSAPAERGSAHDVRSPPPPPAPPPPPPGPPGLPPPTLFV